MSRLMRWLVVVVAIAAISGVGYLVYDQFLRGDQIAPLSLSSPGPEATDRPESSSSASPGADGTNAPPTDAGDAPSTDDPVTASSLAGPWTVADGSVAGYRVREQLAQLPAESDAVGRTDAVSGTVELTQQDGLQVTQADLEVDLTQLTSDDQRRDQRLRTMGIETDRFPSAEFRLSEPVSIPDEALSGAMVELTIRGDLTLHGVTKAVEIPVQAQLRAGSIELVGSVTFPFSDFEIDPPSVGGFVTVHEDATLEFQVLLEQAD